MTTELRFLTAILLMVGVLVGTNILFPPIPPDPVPVEEGAAPPGPGEPAGLPDDPAIPPASEGSPTVEPAAPAVADPTGPPVAEAPSATPERLVTVRGPLWSYTFSTRGARLVSAELLEFQSFRREGRVDLVPEGSTGLLGQKVVVGRDTVDLTTAPFSVEPEGGLDLTGSASDRTLRFTYRHPTAPFEFEVAYTFDPGLYQVTAEGHIEGLERPLLVTDLGEGLPYAEVDSAQETRSMAYVANHAQDGIDSWSLSRSDPRVIQGPLLWAAFRNKFFVVALIPGATAGPGEGAGPFLGGMLVAPGELEERTHVQVAQAPGMDGRFGYRLFVGPQEYARLSSLGDGLEEVNPYGWRIFRPIVRPFVSVIIAVLTFLHDRLGISYGWVLVIFGVMMRVVLWPLNHKAMRAQLKNMAVQPLLQEIQKKHKDNPEKLQKEMLKLHKEHGFNPLAGCWPMLLPWPVLIALFFVFQNAIEFRGVPFLWLPDLSAKDPLYILPLFLALSMFLMQYVNYRAMEQPNPQLKMMMYIMPLMMGFIFLNLASGLNLYYATVNIATIPQQIWITKERKKVVVKRPTPTAAEPAESG